MTNPTETFHYPACKINLNCTRFLEGGKIFWLSDNILIGYHGKSCSCSHCLNIDKNFPITIPKKKSHKCYKCHSPNHLYAECPKVKSHRKSKPIKIPGAKPKQRKRWPTTIQDGTTSKETSSSSDTSSDTTDQDCPYSPHTPQDPDDDWKNDAWPGFFPEQQQREKEEAINSETHPSITELNHKANTILHDLLWDYPSLDKVFPGIPYNYADNYDEAQSRITQINALKTLAAQAFPVNETYTYTSMKKKFHVDRGFCHHRNLVFEGSPSCMQCEIYNQQLDILHQQDLIKKANDSLKSFLQKL
jgi:hypothetical protein